MFNKVCICWWKEVWTNSLVTWKIMNDLAIEENLTLQQTNNSTKALLINTGTAIWFMCPTLTHSNTSVVLTPAIFQRREINKNVMSQKLTCKQVKIPYYMKDKLVFKPTCEKIIHNHQILTITSKEMNAINKFLC